jgi:hypothetical protein
VTVPDGPELAEPVVRLRDPEAPFAAAPEAIEIVPLLPPSRLSRVSIETPPLDSLSLAPLETTIFPPFDEALSPDAKIISPPSKFAESPATIFTSPARTDASPLRNVIDPDIPSFPSPDFKLNAPEDALEGEPIETRPLYCPPPPLVRVIEPPVLTWGVPA